MLPSGPSTRTKRAGFHPPRADNWKDQKSTARAKARQGRQGKVLRSTYSSSPFFALRRGSSSSVLSPTPVGIRAGQAAPKSTVYTSAIGIFQFLLWSSAIRP
jgi:hypothetical protein